MRVRFLAPALTLVLAAPLSAQQQDFSKVEIKAEKLAETIYMLTGAGRQHRAVGGRGRGFMIDDQFAPMTPKIQAAIAAITPKP